MLRLLLHGQVMMCSAAVSPVSGVPEGTCLAYRRLILNQCCFRGHPKSFCNNIGPPLPTCAMHKVVSYLGSCGRAGRASA
jgi:hypothetical protein